MALRRRASTFSRPMISMLSNSGGLNSLPGDGDAQDAEYLVGLQAALFDVLTQGRFGRSVGDFREGGENFEGAAGNSSRLGGRQVFGNQVGGGGKDFRQEEEAGKRQAVIQRDEPLADQGRQLEQNPVIHNKTGFFEEGFDPRGEVFGAHQADVGAVKVVELGEVDRGGGSGQAVDVEALNHLVEVHHVIFGDAPAHQHDPVEHAFGGVAEVF